MTTILLGAGASIPFFTPRLDTGLLTDAIKERTNWQKVLEKYNHVECDKGTRRATPTVDEIMLLIDTIVTNHPNYNFEQIAEVVDKYCSIKIDAIEQKTMLSSIFHLVNTLSGKNDISHDKRWRDVPFLLREIIADKIIDTQSNHHAENYDQLQQKQDEFLQLVCKQDEEVSIISLNYDDCIVKSARHLNFDFCFTFNKDKGFIQNAPAILNNKKVILFPHGHLRLCPLNNGTTDFFHDSVTADKWRWNYLFDTITDGTATYTPATFAYNFNTFITTGQTKDDCLNNEPFSAYYQRMTKDLLSSDRVIIIGYSFSDEHINRFLKSFLHRNPNNKVLVVDYIAENITMTDEYKKPDNIITKLHRVFSPQWSILVDNEGNKNPMDKKQVEQLNTIGYGKIFDNVLFYKKGYDTFLNGSSQVLQLFYSHKRLSICQRIKLWIKKAVHRIRSLFALLVVLFVLPTFSFSQSPMSDLYKQWMIEDINNGKFDKAAQEIIHITDWYFDENSKKAFVDINKALSFADYADSVGIAKPFVDSLSLYVEDECYLLFNYYYSNGNYDVAIPYCELTAEINRVVLGVNHPDYTASLNNLGALYNQMGDYAKAETYYLQALEIRKNILGESHPDYATSLYNLGILYFKMGDYAKAEIYYLQTLEIRKNILGKNHPNYAAPLNNLGILYSDIGDYAKAETYYLQALEIDKNVLGENHPSYAASLLNLGNLYNQMGDYAQAETYYLQALEIQKRVFGKTHPDYAASLLGLGDLYYHMGDYAQAETYYLQALEIQKKALGENHVDYAGSLNNLGILYNQMGDYAKAGTYFSRALEITKNIFGETHPDYAGALNNVGALYYFMNDYAKAEKYIIKAAHIWREQYIHSLDFMSESQRELYWKTLKGRYETYFPTFTLHYHVANPRISSFAFGNELFAKGLLLASSDNIRRSILESGDPRLIDQWNELTTKKQQIAIFEEKDPQAKYLEELRTEAEQLEKEITKSSAAFRQSKDQWNITWDSVRNHLGNNQVAIEYMVAPLSKDSTMYCALLLRNNSQYPEFIPLFEKKEVATLVNTTSENQTSFTYSFDGNGATMQQLVWSKILPHVKPGETIYFAPSGLLHQVAIEALPYDETHTMADMFNLVRLSSTREIVLNKASAQHSTATLYGGIQYNMTGDELLAESEQYAASNLLASRGIDDDALDRGSVKYLPGTKKEVETINQMLHDNNLSVKLYTSTTANEESFKAISGKHQNILHIATHGFYWADSTAQKKDYFSQRMLLIDDKTPTSPTIDPLNRCGLLFAGANTALSGHSADLPEGVQDGILTAKEISLLDLRDADLVILSACETGKGEITGEGVFGLQRAFKQAGAQTIIMSLWPVNDAATQLLMTEFYRNWITNHQSKREAFRNAQNTVRSQYEEPVYWAGFIMLD